MHDPKAAVERPTRVRYSILALLCVLAMITYLDRAANGKAKPYLVEALQISDADFFWVFISFQLAYALFEIPSGWLGDTYGARTTLLRIVLWWSLFVALTGMAGWSFFNGQIHYGFTALLVVQFLFGIGEAGAFPNISKALYNWFPPTHRGTAKSVIWMSARLMGGLTPLVWVILVDIGGVSWRSALGSFAGLAVLWCIVFAYWFRNRPDEHSSTNNAERALSLAGRSVQVGPVHVPWKAIFGSRNMFFLCVMYIATNFNWYYLMYYLPDALKNQFQVKDQSDLRSMLLAVLGGAPLLIGMLGCYLGGYLSDRSIRRTGDRKWGRRWVGMLGYGLAGTFYFLAAGVKVADPGNLWLFAGCLIMVGFTNDLIMAPAWAAAQDIGQNYAATVSGAMNMVGNLFGSVLGLLVSGLIQKHFPGNGDLICFMLYGTIYFLGVAAWANIDASKPIVSTGETQA